MPRQPRSTFGKVRIRQTRKYLAELQKRETTTDKHSKSPPYFDRMLRFFSGKTGRGDGEASKVIVNWLNHLVRFHQGKHIVFVGSGAKILMEPARIIAQKYGIKPSAIRFLPVSRKTFWDERFEPYFSNKRFPKNKGIVLVDFIADKGETFRQIQKRLLGKGIASDKISFEALLEGTFDPKLPVRFEVSRYGDRYPLDEMHVLEVLKRLSEMRFFGDLDDASIGTNDFGGSIPHPTQGFFRFEKKNKPQLDRPTLTRSDTVDRYRLIDYYLRAEARRTPPARYNGPERRSGKDRRKIQMRLEEAREKNISHGRISDSRLSSQHDRRRK